MRNSEIDKIVNDFESIRDLLTEIEIKTDDTHVLFFEPVEKMDNYQKAFDAFNDFEGKLNELLSISGVTDKHIYDSIKGIVDKSMVSEAIGEIYVYMKISRHRKKVKHQGYFSKSDISIKQIIVSLDRLVQLARRLGDIYSAKIQIDDIIFKPSNLSSATILNLIDNTITSISSNISLTIEQKIEVNNYLNSAKTELCLHKPSWQKVVGALMIVAALLSGIADAPQAYENVSKAIRYILGNSIEQHMPPSFQTPRPQIEGSLSVDV